MILQIEALEAWKLLNENSNSVLIDVRTKEEIEFVGFVDLSNINGKALQLPWKHYPQMTVDEAFTDKLMALVSKLFLVNPEETNLLFLCRSGNRSFEAAMFMSDFGYRCYNIINGFEGSLNDLERRGTTNGWKSKNLPWRQN